MQSIGVLIAGDAPQLIAFSGDTTVRIVGKCARGAAGQGDLCQAVGSIPLVLGDRASFVLTSDLPTQCVIAIFALTAIRQLLFDQFAQIVPAQSMTTAIRVLDLQQTAFAVITVVGGVAVGVYLLGDVALVITLVSPDRFVPAQDRYKAVAVFVQRRCVLWRDDCFQASCFVVPELCNRPQRIFLGNQPAFIVVGVDFFTAVGIGNGDATLVIPNVMSVHLRKIRPVMDAA